MQNCILKDSISKWRWNPKNISRNPQECNKRETEEGARENKQQKSNNKIADLSPNLSMVKTYQLKYRHCHTG